MKTFLHILNTWLVAVVIALVIFLLRECLTYRTGLFFDGLGSYFFVELFFAGALASPSFIVSLVLISLIKTTSYTSKEKLFLWILSAILSVLLNIYVPVILIAPEVVSVNIMFIFWPAYVAVIIAILLRLRQFFSLINKTTYYETDMV